MIFVDTSAFYALADAKDEQHQTARIAFARLLETGEQLATHNYIIVETVALLQHRLGSAVAEKFLNDSPLFILSWVDERMHREAAALFIQNRKRKISFVDCTSFVVMKALNISRAFTFDSDFRAHGFSLYPSGSTDD